MLYNSYYTYVMYKVWSSGIFSASAEQSENGEAVAKGETEKLSLRKYQGNAPQHVEMCG